MTSFLDQLNPFSGNYHAYRNSRKLSALSQIACWTASIGVGLLSLGIFSAFVFRSLIGRASSSPPQNQSPTTTNDVIRIATSRLAPSNADQPGPSIPAQKVSCGEIGARINTMDLFELKLPEREGEQHPKREKIRGQFQELQALFPTAKLARGENNCTYLAFGAGYFTHISDSAEKTEQLHEMAQRQSAQGPLFTALSDHLADRTDSGDLELLCGSDEIMKDLVLVLRREVSEYIRDSFEEQEDGNYRVVDGRLHSKSCELFVNPRVLEEWKAAGVQIPAAELLQTLPATCEQIATPGSRASEAMEYDALAHVFNCPFVDINYKSGLGLQGDEPEYTIRAYPLQESGNPNYTIEDLRSDNIPTNPTFAIIAKNTGHSDLLLGT